METLDKVLSGLSRPKYVIVDTDHGSWTQIACTRPLLEFYDLVSTFPDFKSEEHQFYLKYFIEGRVFASPQGSQFLFKLKEGQVPYDSLNDLNQSS